MSGQRILVDGLRDAGIEGSVKIVPIPMARNKILFRLENLGDEEIKTVNSTAVVNALWSSANPSLEVSPFTLKETSVTGNMPVEEMQSRRLKWNTQEPFNSKISWEQGEMVTLEP